MQAQYYASRRKQKKRKRQFSRKQWKTKEKIKDRVSIDKRPSIVDKRESMLVRIHKCPDKTAIKSEEALRDNIESLPRNFWLSITRDNGLENVLHHEIEIPSYFCDKYCSKAKRWCRKY